MKTLLVLRHAKSSWNDSSLADHERPLNDRGTREAPRVGELLREQQLLPDAIITSDATRAVMTASAVAEAAGYTGEVLTEGRLYLAAPDDIIAVVRDVAPSRAGTILIVGHNPGLEELVAQLTGERHDMQTATLARIDVDIDTWADLELSGGALVAMWRGKELS